MCFFKFLHQATAEFYNTFEATTFLQDGWLWDVEFWRLELATRPIGVSVPDVVPVCMGQLMRECGPLFHDNGRHASQLATDLILQKPRVLQVRHMGVPLVKATICLM